MVFLKPEQTGNLLQIVFHPMVHFLKKCSLNHQICIMDRYGNLITECTKNIELGCRKLVWLFGIAGQNARNLLANLQWNHRDACQTFLFCQCTMDVIGLILDVVRSMRLTGCDDLSRDTLRQRKIWTFLIFFALALHSL